MIRSFRSTKDDDRHIAQICLDRGGISPTDAIRVALAECASKKPTLVVKPAMAPVKDVEGFLKRLKTFGEDLVYVAETGLPTAGPEASPVDRWEIDAARAKFRALNERIDGMLAELEARRRLIAAIEVCALPDLVKAAEYLSRSHESNNRLSVDPNVSEGDRKSYKKWAQCCSGPILEWLRAAGILSRQKV